jgi:ArsR family metal-binding transcriptional regulator
LHFTVHSLCDTLSARINDRDAVRSDGDARKAELESIQPMLAEAVEVSARVEKPLKHTRALRPLDHYKIFYTCHLKRCGHRTN